MNYIAGNWVPATDGRTYLRENPADLVDVVGAFPDSGPADARRAAAAARAAFGSWRQVPASRRAEIVVDCAARLRAAADEVGAILTREEGKPLARARGEVVRAAEALEYFAGAALRPTGATIASGRPGVSLSTVVEPVGAFLLITPFNFPLFVTALKLGPALVSGNTVVWKPSPHVPATSIALMRLLVQAGIPDGVVNLVLGGSPELGRSLVDDPGIDGISFTGSTAVGLDVGTRAAARHARVQQEMGGKNVLAVATDFDLRTAAQIACESALGESGQKCTAAGLVIVDSHRMDAFLEHVSAIMAGLALGDPAAVGTDLGPLIDATALRRAETLLSDATDNGAICEIEGGGDVRVDLAKGHYLLPRVMRLPHSANPLKSQESFAPILSLVPADDVLADSLRLVEESRMGLSASILTNDLAIADEFARRVPAGLVNVNLPTTGVEFQAPFGGWNQSGGAFPEAGANAHLFYTRTKTLARANPA
jgi:alpha-ketoglutaric semialdehyde dehydrogenase